MTTRASVIRSTEWAEKKGPDGVAKYQQTKNAKSLDGLTGLESVQ